MNEIERLLGDGILGFYDQVEITEVFGSLPDKSIVNILTLIVAENRNGEKVCKPKLINKDRIVLNKLKGWNFGVLQYTKTIKDILQDIKKMEEEKNWSASGEKLSLEDDFLYCSSKFVPPDSFEEVPLNKVLKNNFWNGSHIIEWQNTSKKKITPLLESPTLLQELSEKLLEHTPISVASVSDRLGNFIIQIPVTILQARFQHSRSENDLKLNVAYHPLARPRKLRVNCDMEYDDIINGYASFEIIDTELIIPMAYDHGPHKGIVWDDENNLILAATRPSSFISTMSYGMHMVESEPRIFKINSKGGQENVRVSIQQTQRNTVGNKNSNQDSWTQKRLYRDEKIRLSRQKKFVQYKPRHGEIDKEHQKAISDIKLLINQYGENGVWLWDPYLDATDVLKTLFYCPFYGADLRALTNLSTFNDKAEPEEAPAGKNAQLLNQKRIFDELDSNLFGIKFEFRARIGNAGWNFHDRFLIFPNIQQGVLAWSLGTSVNSLGKQHHILQQVDDGQLIADSFMELWDQLDHPDNLIWKY